MNMPKNLYFDRYIWLYDTISKIPNISANELFSRYSNYIQNKMYDSVKPLSKRTFYRDMNEMKELFGIEISSKEGYVVETMIEDINNKLLIDSYRHIQIFHCFKDIEKFIVPELKKTGSEHLMDILDAIKNRRPIRFKYKRYVCNEETERKIEPYFLKEFKGRWYMIGRDKDASIVKTFALERITNSITQLYGELVYSIPSSIGAETYFMDNFGVFKMINLPVEDVIFSVKLLKGSFFKSQPLHHSQEIIREDENECVIKLRLQITHDFKMELLSHGLELKVLEPENLVRDIRWELQMALEQY